MKKIFISLLLVLAISLPFSSQLMSMENDPPNNQHQINLNNNNNNNRRLPEWLRNFINDINTTNQILSILDSPVLLLFIPSLNSSIENVPQQIACIWQIIRHINTNNHSRISSYLTHNRYAPTIVPDWLDNFSNLTFIISIMALIYYQPNNRMKIKLILEILSTLASFYLIFKYREYLNL